MLIKIMKKTIGNQVPFFVAMLALALLLTTQASAQNPFGTQPVFTQSSGPVVNNTVTISQPGSYVLQRDVRVSSGDGIVITAMGVTLDLNGRSVTTEARGTGRGIFINGATGVEIKNGRVGGFMMNVIAMNTVNARVSDLRITGAGLAPNNGPSEIGIVLLNSRAGFINRNTITNVNLGIFVRGGGSTGNRISENTVVGGAMPANNLLGICYNPAPGADAAVDGPSGDIIYNNHIARFGFAIALSAATERNIFRENTLSSFNAGIRELDKLTTGGGSNIADGNLETTLPAIVLNN